MEKTLVGKDGWLFLQNDSCRELEVHCNNLCLSNEHFQRDRYASHMEKICLIIIPNKSYVYSQYLPAEYVVKYRPAFDMYKNIFGDRMLDGYDILKGLPETYYKTDTHINFCGAYLVYCAWIQHVNKLFDLSLPLPDHTIIREEVPSLSNLQIGVGDLTWDSNCGSIVIDSTADVFFRSETVESIYISYKISADGPIKLLEPTLEDITETHEGAIMDWSIVSKYILFKKNPTGIAKKVIIFYSSCLLSTMSLYMNLFSETYMVKNIYDPMLVNQINPDLVFEFRVERFLL
jgi:hypothetical protein